MHKKKEPVWEEYESEVQRVGRRLRATCCPNKRDSLHKACTYVLMNGGKRLRPFLVLASAEAAGGSSASVYNAAVAIELLHNATLVHDDIMDEGEKRHGKQALHRKYGINTAILAGDMLFATAYATLLKNRMRDTRDIVLLFTKGIMELCEGQSLDSEFESRQDASLLEYRKMIYKKTASLTELSCSIGARLSSASTLHVKALSNYGRYLGMAFQIQDDLLDVVAEEHLVGKTVGGDFVRGKKTYLQLRAMEKARGIDRARLMHLMNKGRGNEETVHEFREFCAALGVAEDAEKEAGRYLDRAARSLKPLPDNNGKKMLQRLVDELRLRSK